MYQIENPKARVQAIDLGGRDNRIVLVPGINEVADAKWEIAKKNPMVKAALDRGDLKEGAHSTKDDGVKAMSQAEALKVIARTMDIPTLGKWKGTETRPAVAVAIDKQIANIQSQAAKELSDAKNV